MKPQRRGDTESVGGPISFLCVSVPLWLLFVVFVHAGPNPYAWLSSYDPSNAIEVRIAPPPEFERVSLPAGSFGAWLRGLPLKPGRPPVYLYDGRPKRNQEAHWAVVEIDTGRGDLQQCADAVIRLRAEYLYAHGRRDDIAFDFTSGDEARFSRWAEGLRPVVDGRRVSWRRSGRAEGTYASFRAYLATVFTYAGSASLARELLPVRDASRIEPGDVFIQGGSPGHVVLVVDVALRRSDGRRVFLLAQSYMPAQEIHILKNPLSEAGPWYDAAFSGRLETPEWTFDAHHLRRFPVP